MTAHAHAHLIKAYADDTSTPFQFFDYAKDTWEDCIMPNHGVPLFSKNVSYRIKPKDTVKYFYFCPMTTNKWETCEEWEKDNYYMTIAVHYHPDAEYPYKTTIIQNQPFLRS